MRGHVGFNFHVVCFVLMAARTAQPCHWWCCKTTLTIGLVVNVSS